VEFVFSQDSIKQLSVSFPSQGSSRQNVQWWVPNPAVNKWVFSYHRTAMAECSGRWQDLSVHRTSMAST